FPRLAPRAHRRRKTEAAGAFFFFLSRCPLSASSPGDAFGLPRAPAGLATAGLSRLLSAFAAALPADGAAGAAASARGRMNTWIASSASFGVDARQGAPFRHGPTFSPERNTAL